MPPLIARSPSRFDSGFFTSTFFKKIGYKSASARRVKMVSTLLTLFINSLSVAYTDYDHQKYALMHLINNSIWPYSKTIKTFILTMKFFANKRVVAEGQQRSFNQ